MIRKELLAYLDEYLQTSAWQDMGVNGLQVEGKNDISKIATGVSASGALFSRASEWGADTVLVHHGILWDKLDPVIRGPHRKRLAHLLKHDMNLLAHHLPLDGHPEIGNNALLAKELGLKDTQPAFPYHGPPLGVIAREDLSIGELKERLVRAFGDPIHHIGSGPERVRRIGIVSGGAQTEYLKAIVEDCDAYITGEHSEYVVGLAEESGTHLFACGHYRT